MAENKEFQSISTSDVGTLVIQDDKVNVADLVFADVQAGGGDPPLFPCPKCMRETKVHHDLVERHPDNPKKVINREPQRICSNRACRFIVTGEEMIEAVAAKGKSLQPIIFPCDECGKPTKEHQPDPETEEPRRICSSATCRHVQFDKS